MIWKKFFKVEAIRGGWKVAKLLAATINSGVMINYSDKTKPKQTYIIQP